MAGSGCRALYRIPVSPDWAADALDSVAIVRMGIDVFPLLRIVERDHGCCGYMVEN